jgi:hypothetical protein
MGSVHRQQDSAGLHCVTALSNVYMSRHGDIFRFGDHRVTRWVPTRPPDPPDRCPALQDANHDMSLQILGTKRFIWRCLGCKGRRCSHTIHDGS